MGSPLNRMTDRHLCKHYLPTISLVRGKRGFTSCRFGEPERWLTEEGQIRIVPEFLPFGLGMCLYNTISSGSRLEHVNICNTDNICWLKSKQ